MGVSQALIKHASLENIVADGLTFDTVVVLDVLEYVADPVKFLWEVKKLLNPNGKLVLSVPAIPEFYDERDKLS